MKSRWIPLCALVLLFSNFALAQKGKGKLIGVNYGWMQNPNPKGKLKKRLKEFLLPKMLLVNIDFRNPVKIMTNDITIGSFYISEREVSNQQFCVFLNAYSSQSDTLTDWFDFSSIQNPFVQTENGLLVVKEGLEDEPITNVSWLGATAYGKWLANTVNEIMAEYGIPPLPNYRLPSEVEWEYMAWLQDQKEKTDLEHISKNKKAIKGVEGMMNGTLEWAEDVYVQNPFEFKSDSVLLNSIKYEEVDSEKPLNRVIRGGFVNPATAMSISYTTRNQLAENEFSPNVGFRVVMTYLGRTSYYEF